MKLMLAAMAESMMQMMGIEHTEVVDATEVVTSESVLTLDDLNLGYDVMTLPMKSPIVLRAFLSRNESLVYDYGLKVLNMAVRKNLPEVVLFRLGESDKLAIINSEDYEEQLTKLMLFYINRENYEQAGLCSKLLKRVSIDRIISESQML